MVPGWIQYWGRSRDQRFDQAPLSHRSRATLTIPSAAPVQGAALHRQSLKPARRQGVSSKKPTSPGTRTRFWEGRSSGRSKPPPDRPRVRARPGGSTGTTRTPPTSRPTVSWAPRGPCPGPALYHTATRQAGAAGNRSVQWQEPRWARAAGQWRIPPLPPAQGSPATRPDNPSSS